MPAGWELLERAGVPFGARGGDPPSMADRAEIVAAVHHALAPSSELSERQRVSLLAWLRAWASEWPTSFAAAFGSSATGVLESAAARVDDLGRYLKLRRLAREHLARIL